MEKEASLGDYCLVQKGMICAVYKDYGKVLAQARRAWVTRPVNNWTKAFVCSVLCTFTVAHCHQLQLAVLNTADMQRS